MSKLNSRTKMAHVASDEPPRDPWSDEWNQLLTELLVPGVLQRPLHDCGARRVR